MQDYKVLVVEDEKNISDVITAYLEKDGFEVYQAFDGQEALDIFREEDFQFIILDLMLPKVPGEEVCKKIRSYSDVPIIILTAKTEEEDRIKGLNIGADDYVVKPFSPRELVTRVKTIMRRIYPNKALAQTLSFNDEDLIIDIPKMKVLKENKRVEITSNEFKLLASLIKNKNQVLSREQLIEISFGYDYDGFNRTIDTYIKNLRQKIEDDPKKPRYIQTVYGAGYKFVTK